MPTYLCHGFRWKRESIIYFTLLHSVDDASPDWIIKPGCSEALLDTILDQHPYVPGGAVAGEPQENESTAPADEQAASGPDAEENDDVSETATGTEEEAEAEPAALRFLEEYNLEDETSWASQHAYVADHVVKVDLSVDIAQEMEDYENKCKDGGQKWFERLRDELYGVGDAAIRWYIVVCDDEERAYDDSEAEDEEGEEEEMATPEPPTSKSEAPNEATTADGPRPGGNLVGKKAAEPKKGLRSGLKGILPLGRRRKE